MGMRKWRTALRRATTVVASTTVLVMVGAGAAMAFPSGGNPQGYPGDNTVQWTGNGAHDGVLDTTLCPGEGGGQPYLLWIFTTDGGSVVPGTPTLTLSGSGSGTYQTDDPSADSSAHFVTPYYTPDPAQLHASVSFTIGTDAKTGLPDTGNGSWNLVISHGCAPSVPTAKALIISKTANGTFDTAYKWGIAKSVDQNKINTADSATFNYKVTVTHDAGTNSNYQVNGKVTVTNPNSVPVAITGLTDSLAGGQPQDISGGATQVGPGSTDFPYHFSLGDNPPSGSLDDTATVTWGDQPVQGTSGLKGDTASATASTGTFTQDKVTNQLVTVSDPNAPDGTFRQLDATKDPLSVDFPYSVTFNDPAGTCTSHKNTATIDQTGQTADQAVQVCVGADLKVSKTATPSFDRTYGWNISKSVNPAKVEQIGGQAIFHYTVGVTHDNGTDGNWQVNGTIHVANPNDWESVSLTGVTDAIDNGGNCTITSGDPNGSIPAGGSADLGYQCTYSSAPQPSNFTNTATVTWDKDAASTPHGSVDGTATGDFAKTDPNIVDSQASITDPLGGGTLGVVKYTDPSPTNFTYDNTVNVPQFGCTTVNNTATFTTNDTGATGSASQTVYACGPVQTGALTMGYWQNKNGQAQITGAPNQAALKAYLQGHAPFKDLTTQSVAVYVTNVIKAANASGASMNAMLKAQMLSTALDVYFKGSIGGTTIDLTKVYTGSGYVDASSAFGGAASMDVNHVLGYAAGQSNAGGTSWYGQNKATQELAKDVFDAINNQWAFGA